MMRTLRTRLAAEALGTGLLVATVVGSGIMAERLAGGNVALALLANTLATGAILFVLITVFGPISGAQFNPAVSLIAVLRGGMTARDAVFYTAAQIVGGLVGTLLAHGMFDLALLQTAVKLRTGPGQWLSEGVATFGLIVTIIGTLRARAEAIPMAVALYITAAYWFTASTSFANPAVTIARAFTATFAGIQLGDVPLFIIAQLFGALAGVLAMRAFAPDDERLA
jgi:glycerol uptake facilitator-like aquaporin